MARLISLTVFEKDSTALSPSVTYAVPADSIKFALAATTKQKQAVPSASQGINTAVHINELNNNNGENHIYLVNETVAAIVTASA